MKAESIEASKLATELGKVVSPIVPELLKVAGKDREFSVTIENDEEGIRVKIGVAAIAQADEIREADDMEALDHIIKAQLSNALVKSKGNIKKAAGMCGMSVRGFKREMFRLNVEK